MPITAGSAGPSVAGGVFATDDHRIGLKPILRRIRAPKGQRPIARGHHRFEWLYVTAFVSPATGGSFWYLGTGVDKELFADTLAPFARKAGAGRDRIILRVLDGAGWHTAPGLAVPEGIRLVYLPPYTPELQPAETLWVHVDKPIANNHFATLADLDVVVAGQSSSSATTAGTPPRCHQTLSVTICSSSQTCGRGLSGVRHATAARLGPTRDGVSDVPLLPERGARPRPTTGVTVAASSRPEPGQFDQSATTS